MTYAIVLAPTAAPRRRRLRDIVMDIVRMIRRSTMTAAGALLVVTGIVIAPLPGPFGLPVSVLGLAIILKSSYWAKRQFIRAQKARPRYVYPFRRLLRKEPEIAPVFWQQALRVEKLVLRGGESVLARGRKALRRRFAKPATA